ncbi:OsmC family protein [Pseudopedobacter saltans DSM 12145]|uniref:OsmC family protein n=1 Tax=Pseudopedobacter saltans (strain ATCC 51119 / DSM 12145 / JCM 21818 / CCUG 39354 / LMG 10337 / NBRC 100064 / NCIMB 13643) TaxID=762903 RepID=F0S7F4_PSESL|nr:OsmC family protein [Pseudopedobacter saltans]ADY51179.1 OsmC family protein [Pseudopedobacter saltans DSM 12145]
MEIVKSLIGAEPYKVEITSNSGNMLIADEPESKGGKNKGFSPKELLISALAACTSATVKMYADRKQWNLKEIKTVIELESDDVSNKTIINRKVSFIGDLDEKQRERLIAVANACPLHKILSNPIEINTSAV